jgi:hypothetical protein
MKNRSRPGFELQNLAFVASILSLDHQSRYQLFSHIKISSIQNYQGFLPVTFTVLADLFPHLGSSHGQLSGDFLYLALVVQILKK